MIKNLTQNTRIAIALLDSKNYDIDVEEMTELARTAGMNVEIVFSQNKPIPESITYFGTGKLLEIKQTMKAMELKTIIFYDNLSPIQHANISDAIGCEVLDRTNLILYIFSLHARTAEGKIQVELARLRYILPRLHSEAGELSRQGAGVLARGPGETKLELDKRNLKDQIHRLKLELEDIQKQRDITRRSREKNQIPLIALVGYTNAGKSTLFNRITNSNVLVENKLFATLDTTIRRVDLADNLVVLFSDTVGFIRDLPHNLIESFKSTLEETCNADLILNVCDASSPQVTEHNITTHAQLSELKVTAKIIDVYNKIDLVEDKATFDNENSVSISAKTGLGIDKLLNRIIAEIHKRYIPLSLLLPYTDMGRIQDIQNIGYNCTIEYIENGVRIEGNFKRTHLNTINKYILRE